MDQDSITFGRMPDLEDRVSLRDVFDASYRKLVVQLYGVTGSFDEAEDVVQEAFVRAAAAGRRFLRVDNHEAWLRTTADQRAPQPVAQAAATDSAPVTGCCRPATRAALEDHLEIITALRALPEQQRQVIALHYLADLPVHEIAEELGVPVGTVKSRLSRGREALAARLAYVRRRRRPCLSDCWRRSARRPSVVTRVPAFELIEAGGRARRRRRHAVDGCAWLACVLGRQRVPGRDDRRLTPDAAAGRGPGPVLARRRPGPGLR